MRSDPLTVRAAVESHIAKSVLPYYYGELLRQIVGYTHHAAVGQGNALALEIHVAKARLLALTLAARLAAYLTHLGLALIVVRHIQEDEIAREYEFTHSAKLVFVEGDDDCHGVAERVIKVGEIFAFGKRDVLLAYAVFCDKLGSRGGEVEETVFHILYCINTGLGNKVER